jgi:hypothetical protein
MNTDFGARTLDRLTVQMNERVGIIRARRAWRALKRAEARASRAGLPVPAASGNIKSHA